MSTAPHFHCGRCTIGIEWEEHLIDGSVECPACSALVLCDVLCVKDNICLVFNYRGLESPLVTPPPTYTPRTRAPTPSFDTSHYHCAWCPALIRWRKEDVGNRNTCLTCGGLTLVETPCSRPCGAIVGAAGDPARIPETGKKPLDGEFVNLSSEMKSVGRIPQVGDWVHQGGKEWVIEDVRPIAVPTPLGIGVALTGLVLTPFLGETACAVGASLGREISDYALDIREIQMSVDPKTGAMLEVRGEKSLTFATYLKWDVEWWVEDKVKTRQMDRDIAIGEYFSHWEKRGRGQERIWRDFQLLEEEGRAPRQEEWDPQAAAKHEKYKKHKQKKKARRDRDDDREPDYTSEVLELDQDGNLDYWMMESE